jgi:hypothetical protein
MNRTTKKSPLKNNGIAINGTVKVPTSGSVISINISNICSLSLCSPVWLCLENTTIFRFFQVFLSFFVFGVSRLFLPCFGLSRVLACRGRFHLSICSPWLPLAGSHPVADIARVFLAVGVVGVVGLFVCVIAWLSSSPSVAGCRPVAGCALQAVAVCVYPCQGVRLSNKCSIRAFRTNFRNTCSRVFLATCQNFQPNLTEFLPTESLKFLTEPNRIGISQSSTESLIGLLPRLALHDR